MTTIVEKPVNGDKLPERSKFIPKGISDAEIVEFALKGLTGGEIAKLTGCTTSNINMRLKPWRNRVNGLKAYKRVDNDVLKMIESNFALSLANTDTKDVKPLDQAKIMGITRDKLNIEAGKGQGADITIHIQQNMDAMKQIELELKQLESKPMTPDGVVE